MFLHALSPRELRTLQNKSLVDFWLLKILGAYWLFYLETIMKTSRVALITGVTGQDGSYLSEFLLSRGYEVHGMIRRSSSDYRERIAHLEGKPHFHLHFGHLDDSMSIIQIMNKVRPDEVYNLAAQSHVQ